jgi:ribosomal protein L40E
MFCDQCGAQLQTGDQRCGRCGKTVLRLTELRRSRVQQHVQMLSILWMAYGALETVGGVVVIVVAKTFFGHIHIEHGPPPEVTAWLEPFLTFIGWMILVKAAAGFIAGWGLLQRQEWARIFALVVGFVALLNVPIGTTIGVYTLWVLLPTQSDEEYKALAQAA